MSDAVGADTAISYDGLDMVLKKTVGYQDLTSKT